MQPFIAEQPRFTREQEIRRAMLRVVAAGSQPELALLAGVTEREWRGQLQWLDISGMALYFFDRLQGLRRSDLLPPSMLLRLEANLADNALRTRGMIAKAAGIRDAFEQEELNFALLKGISLSPDAVARPELRSQLDIDFLVAQEDITQARKILERHGYYLHAIAGRTWEFKTHAVPSSSMKDLYRDVPWGSIDLHAEATTREHRSRLALREKRWVEGVEMPVLCACDAFIGQGLHLFKHVSSSHYRASHLVEFHRYLQTCSRDESFWPQVEARAMETGAAGAAWALGIVTLLAEQLLGECAPENFARWTLNRLSPPLRLWVEMYGWRTALGGIPGNKLYALLVRELEKEGLEAHRAAPNSARAPETVSEVKAELRSARGSLVPKRLPPMVLRGQAGEPLRTRAARFRLQLRFLLLRLHFHLVEGLRFLLESRRWKRRLREIEGKDSPAICPANKGMTIR